MVEVKKIRRPRSFLVISSKFLLRRESLP